MGEDQETKKKDVLEFSVILVHKAAAAGFGTF